VWSFDRLAHTANVSTQGSNPCENNTRSEKQTVWYMNGVHSPNREDKRNKKET
jgi:hypothetical protein